MASKIQYRHPDTGQWISETEYNRLLEGEQEEIDYGDDEYDWGYDFDEGEYEA